MQPSIKHPIPLDVDFKAWLSSMPIVTVDFETYYDSKYSLKRMTMIEYVQHELFKAQGVSIRVDRIENNALVRGTPVYYENVDDGMAFLRKLDKWTLVAQNTKFEGYILHYHYGIHPTVYADTKSMSKGLWPFQSASLENLCKRLWPHDETMRKGDELIASMGIRDWNAEMHQLIGHGYCNKDVFLTAEAFWAMFNEYPTEELEIIHITCRMFCHPTMRTDHEILKNALTAERIERQQLLDDALEMIAVAIKHKGLDYWNACPKDAKKKLPLDKRILTSRNRFIKLMKEIFDRPIPLKTNPKGKLTEATGKNDPEFIEYMEENRDLARLFEAKMAWASSQSSSRARRMIDFSKPEKGYEIPIPLGYYNAHTGRFSGEEKINMQNLQRNSPHRLSLYAPQGFQTFVCDSSNIEARVLATIAGQTELIHAFHEKKDVYAMFASDVVGFEVNKHDHTDERNMGKVCVGADTQVFTSNGLKRIVDLQPTDKLWDGVEWVNHEGVICNGQKETLTAYGLEATPDHEILVANSWVEWQQVLTNHSLLNQALNSVSLPCLDGKTKYTEAPLLVGTQLSNAAVETQEWWTEGTYSKAEPRGVTSAQNERVQQNDSGNTKTSCRMMNTEVDCSTGYLLQSVDATTSETKCSPIMDNAGSQYSLNGERTEPVSLSTSRHSMDGTNPTSKWTEQTSMVVTNQAISGLLQENKIPAINEKSRTLNSESGTLKTSSLVYDVINAGPRRRFTVMTALGPVIIHNCVLGLGYSMGWLTLQRTFASGPMGMAPMDISDQLAQKMVNTYRSVNYAIKAYWKQADNHIGTMMMLDPDEAIEWGCLKVIQNGIVLPNGMKLSYPGLKYSYDHEGYVYWNGMFWKKLYGGSLVENIVQALARIIVVSQMVQIDRQMQHWGGWITMQVHDENIGVLPDEEQHNEKRYQVIENIMRQTPEWLPQLPLDAEGGYAANYSK